jgi:hypothetical protein
MRVLRRYVALVVVIALAAGCSATAQPTDEPRRNATLSLESYEQASEAAPVETRVFWDRSKNWEDPGHRNVTVTSHAREYHNLSGTDTVVVYTTPKKRYAESDSVRSLPAPDLADLATRSVGVPPIGNNSGSAYRASLLAQNVTVRTVTDDAGDATGYVARTVREDAIVVVVVAGEAEKPTVERVLDGVTLYEGFTTER